MPPGAPFSGEATPANAAGNSPLSPNSDDRAAGTTTSSSQNGSSGGSGSSSETPGAGWASALPSSSSPSPSSPAMAGAAAAAGLEASLAACEWTCCGATSLRAAKCNGRRHALAPGATMLQVRATATRPMLVGHHNPNGGSGSGGSSSSRSGGGSGTCGAEVKVFTELQISLFPEEKHPVQVQLSADVASFLSAYFFPVQSRQAAATLATLRGPDYSTSNGFGDGVSGDGPGSFSGSSGALSVGGAAASDRFLLGNRFAMGGGSSLFGGSAVGGSRELAPDSSSDEEHEDESDSVSINSAGRTWNSQQSIRGTSTSRSSTSTARNSNGVNGSSSNGGSNGNGGGGGAGVEVGGVYLKYFRIGEVELALTTVGFGKKLGVQLDRDRLRLTSPAFHRSERVVTWKQLGQKYVKHLVAHLVTGGAGTRKKSLLSPTTTAPLPSPTDALPLELTSTHDTEAGSDARDEGNKDEGGTLGPSSNRRHYHSAAAGAAAAGAAGGQHSSGSSTARKGGMFGAASGMLRAGTSAAAQAAAATAASTKSPSSNNKADKSREALLFGGRR